MSTFAKKVTSAVAGLAVVFSMVAPIAGVSAAYSSLDAANKLATLGVVVDQSANPSAYRLADTTSREELSKIIANLGGLSVTEGESVYADTDFASWSEKYAKALNEAGYAASNEFFNPKNNATKIEALKWVMEARGIATGTGDNWMEARVNGAVEAGIATAFTDYNADASRGQVFIWAAEAIDVEDEVVVDDNLLCEILGTCEEETETPTDEGENETPVVVDGDVEVSLSPESPINGEVAADTPRTPVLVFDVTAGESDVTLEEVRLDYVGLSDYSDIDNVKLYINDKQVSKGSGKSFNDKYIELSFENDVVVRAGETQSVVVTAEVIDDTTNVAHKIRLTELDTSVDDISGLPVDGMRFNVFQADNIAKIDLDINSVSTSDIEVGEEVTLADFDLEETEDNEDVNLRSLTFELGGSMDHQDDLSDINLYIEGEMIASNLAVDSDEEIIITLDETIPADETINVELVAVVSGSVNDTLSAELTEVYAVGADTGINASINGDAYGITADSREINGSEINVSYDRSDIDEAKPDAEEVHVGTLNLSTDGDYTINKIEVTVENLTNSTALENIIDRVELDGKTSDSDMNLSTNSGAYIFEEISLRDETKILDLTFDIADEASLAGITLDFDVNITEVEDDDFTYTVNGTNAVKDILSTTALKSKEVDIENATFEIVNVDVQDRNLVLGNDVETVIYKGKIFVGDADSVKVNEMSFTQASGYNLNGENLDDVIENATLNIGGVTTDADVETNRLDFDGIDATIAAGADNVEVLVTAELKENDNITNGAIVMQLDASSLDLEDSENNDLVTSDIDTTNANTKLTTTSLITQGLLTATLVEDGDREDEVDDVVLAGSTQVALAEVELEAEYEDMEVNSMKFQIAGGVVTGAGDATLALSNSTTTANVTESVAVAQVTEIMVPASFEGTGVIGADVNGTSYTGSTRAALASAIQAGETVTTSVNGETITLTADTAGTGFTVTNITFDGSSESAITVTTTQPNVVAVSPSVAQVNTATLVGTENTGSQDDTFTATVNSTTFTANSIASLITAINAGSEPVAAVAAGAAFTVTADVAGEPFTLTTSATEFPGVPENDFSDTLNNVRLMDGSREIADGGVVTFDGTNTVIEFKDFMLYQEDDKITATIEADLESFTTSGDQTSATLGDLQVTGIVAATGDDVVGADSRENLDVAVTEFDYSGTAQSVSIVPVLITLSKEDGFNEGDSTAVIGFNIDMGSNDLDDDDIAVTKILFEAGDNAFLDLTAIRNNDGTPMTAAIAGDDITLSSDNEINDGDEFTLTQDTSAAVTSAQQVVIVRKGVEFTVDGNTYTIVNDDITDLDSYKD